MLKTFGERKGEERISSGRHWPRRNGNIRVDFKGTGRECVNWIKLVQCRVYFYVLVNTGKNFRVTQRWRFTLHLRLCYLVKHLSHGFCF
jgi:hypothetical protein